MPVISSMQTVWVFWVRSHAGAAGTCRRPSRPASETAPGPSRWCSANTGSCGAAGKAATRRRHLIDCVPVSDLCDEHQLSPTRSPYPMPRVISRASRGRTDQTGQARRHRLRSTRGMKNQGQLGGSSPDHSTAIGAEDSRWQGHLPSPDSLFSSGKAPRASHCPNSRFLCF